ncbi:hypothetical protein MCP1_100005 [Candidatus Terasakiella magnetica]|nr:hypothetical protein MCP1_100005 [Candidatus Terasakiella magnetica]
MRQNRPEPGRTVLSIPGAHGGLRVKVTIYQSISFECRLAWLLLWILAPSPAAVAMLRRRVNAAQYILLDIKYKYMHMKYQAANV